MYSIKVKQLMVPLAEYATVSEEATLYEAVVALEEAQKKVQPEREPHRAVLVLDKDQKVVGKLSQWDVIKGIEPKYKMIANINETLRHGLGQEFIKSLFETYGFWAQPLEDICRKAATIKVKDLMYTLGEGEFVAEDASLDRALHQFVMGRHQSLLVTKGKDIVGVLRLSDVFKEIGDRIKACKI
jgi:CBS domain-containing protein